MDCNSSAPSYNNNTNGKRQIPSYENNTVLFRRTCMYVKAMIYFCELRAIDVGEKEEEAIKQRRK
jgi:hypothetical protein